MGCLQSAMALPTGTSKIPPKRPKGISLHLETDSDPSLKVCVVTSPGGSTSPKSSPLDMLGLYDDGEDNGINRETESKYVFQTAADITTKKSKRPFIEINNTGLGSLENEYAANSGDSTVAETKYTIDDIADELVEFSTDDDSSDDDSDSESHNLSDSIKFSSQQSLSSCANSNVSLSDSVFVSSEKKPIESDFISPEVLPRRKGSGKWRTSAMLSPAVTRSSEDIFSKKTNVDNKKTGLERLRILSGKIRLGVRLGNAVKKASDMHGMKRINQYLIIRVLGEGTYGKVKLVEDQNSGKQYAMKVIRKTIRKTSRRLSIHESSDTVAKEIAIMKKLNHPNVVRLKEVLETTNQVYLVLEYRRQGPVVDLEKEMVDSDGSSRLYPRLALQTVRKYSRDILKGLSYLHAHGVIHQDLKPNNLLLGQDGSIAISDFGISTLVKSKSDLVRITNNGTPAFMAPELHGAQSSAHSGQASDLWSVGVILYCFVAGKLPFWAPSVIDLSQNIQSLSTPPFPDDLQLPDAFTQLVYGLLKKDPQERTTIAEAAQNSWITRKGRDPLAIITKDNVINSGISATSFELSTAFSFAKIVRIKARVNRFVANARSRVRIQEKLTNSSAFDDEPGKNSSTGRLSRRSVTNKSLIGNNNMLKGKCEPTSLTSYRSAGKSLLAHKPGGPAKGSLYHVDSTGFELGGKSAGECEESSSSDDDLDVEDVVTVEDGAELEFHLMAKGGKNRRKRRFSEVIPGRVDLTGLLSIRHDCINTSLGIVYSSHADQNGKEHMEDRQISFASVNNSMALEGQPPMAFFGVYDGHSGENCAEFIRLNLHSYIFNNIPALLSDPERALKEAFIACDDQFLQSAAENRDQIDYSGSTATVVLLIESKIYIASVGDSRAVLARQGRAIELSRDHVPTLQNETERIHRAGGSIVRGRVQGVLGVSRAFGDIEFKTLKEKSWGTHFSADLVSCEPDIKSIEIQSEDEFIMIASDGLYDCFTSQRVVGRFKSHLQETKGDLQTSIKLLVNDAKEMRPGHDNISATAVLFTGSAVSTRKRSSF